MYTLTSAFSSSRKGLHTMTITMPLHCIPLLLVLMAGSFRLSAAETEPQIPTMDNQSRNFSPLMLELVNRMDEMERRSGNELNFLHRRIEALENLHDSDLQQMSIHNKKINTLEKRVKHLNAFVIKHVVEHGHQPLRGPKHANNHSKVEQAFFYTKNSSSGYGSRSGHKNTMTADTSRNRNPFNILPGVESPKNRITRVGSSVNTGIGFHAILSHVVENPGIGQSIAFRTVMTNLGNNYSPNSGIFRCTHAGLYVLSFTVSVGHHEWINAQIQRNGNMISAVTCGNGYHWTSCAGTAVVELAQGDEVWIAVTLKPQSEVHLESAFSSFSGFLLPWNAY